MEDKKEVTKKEEVKLSLLKVKLLKPHTDSGIDYKENDIIEVDTWTARWLKDNKIGELV